MSNKAFTIAFVFFLGLIEPLFAQQSVARLWNEALLKAVRKDFARPPVQARNIFHTALAMYDAWAAYDDEAQTILLGKTFGNYYCPFEGIPPSSNIEEDRKKAISYAAYRVLFRRYQYSPDATATLAYFNLVMWQLGYETHITSTDYKSGDPAALGNYIAEKLLEMGSTDGSNETYNYVAQYYKPVNPPLAVYLPGNPNIKDPNRWQPLTLLTAVDQNGNPIPNDQRFQSPEWGNVTPFALTGADRISYTSPAGHKFNVYHDPGPQPKLDTGAVTPESEFFKWNMALVSIWSSHLDPHDSVYWDISPATLGNLQSYPETPGDYPAFYKFIEGGDASTGRSVNPRTGQPYAPQWVKRGDYSRALAEFWADGPNSETPPGHWCAIFNKAMEHPDFNWKFNGKGPSLDPLEFQVKGYLALGGALHDAAIAAWSIKGWYDAVRPISAIRYMAEKGQSTDPASPRYHPAGLPLVPGYIELVKPDDPLAGPLGANVNKIKLFTWRGHEFTPAGQAGAGWILAEKWEPFQRKTFVTPPFAGFVSGHSTYSRTAAEVITYITGDEFFPGGLGEFIIPAETFLTVEKGPSQEIKLQWATYRDAADQTSLSRIWGGIHPPFDDIPGRKIGNMVSKAAFEKALSFFYRDQDQDGAFSFEDCDDQDPDISPKKAEVCDGKDNNCDGQTDENLPIFVYYADADADGFGDGAPLSSCKSDIPAGYCNNNQDCDDSNPAIHPGLAETCDDLDNDCNGAIDDGLPQYSWYPDFDGDGFGFGAPLVGCNATPPPGYTANNLDCHDTQPDVHPGATEVCDGNDNNCNGLIDEDLTVFIYYPDQDGDQYGAGEPYYTCLGLPPGGYTPVSGDCDDHLPECYPGAPEIIDGLDNDCDGTADDVSSGSAIDPGRIGIYPNPAKEYFELRVSSGEELYYTVRSASGMLMKSGRLPATGTPERIDCAGWPSGGYVAVLINDHGKSTLKWIAVR